MGIEWTEDLSTNNAEIDNQHKELFRRVNSLLDACGEGKGKVEVGRVIGFFEDYVITHFSAEEQLMLDSSYEGYKTHKSEHADFIAQIWDLKKKFLIEGGGVNVVLLTIRTSVEWLSNHIRKTDRTMADRLRTAVKAR